MCGANARPIHLVLDEERNTGEWRAQIHLSSLGPRAVECHRDNSVELPVAGLDPSNGRIDNLYGRHLAAVNKIGARHGVQQLEVIHARSVAVTPCRWFVRSALQLPCRLVQSHRVGGRWRLSVARMSGFLSYTARIRQLADSHPERTALVVIPVDGEEFRVSWRELIERATTIAHGLADAGVTSASGVVVGLPNGVDHVTACLAAWQLGACVLPLNAHAAAPERDRQLELMAPTAVLADWPDVKGALLPSDLLRTGSIRPVALPDHTPDPGKAIGTGGSTGRPKLIVQPGAYGYDPGMVDLFAGFGFREGSVQLLPGPLYHNFGFDWCYQGLLWDHTIVLLERFDAERAVAAIERHGVQFVGIVPTMMRRIAQLPDIASRDLSSLEAILHSAAACPPQVKEAWIELIGGEKVLEGYGASEGFGNTIIGGDEWLTHRGSVGRPWSSELRILDDEGRELPAGEIGEVFMRRTGQPPNYVGAAPPRMTSDGFGSVGDLGHVDDDGYLYLADRRADLIITGGVNVYPAEVEAVLVEHPCVSDVAVIGLPDEEWGARVHAVVQLHPGSPDPSHEDFTQFCRARLTAYKAPKSYEFVAMLPRDDGGKLRRNALVAQRLEPSFPEGVS